jgi:uncharacterized RmlC-like cupin family protein
MSDVSASKQIRIAHRDALDSDTPQTAGLIRDVAFDARTPDAAHLSAVRSTVKPGAATSAHHHGDQETVLYVISGAARFRWGDRTANLGEERSRPVPPARHRRPLARRRATAGQDAGDGDHRVP